jgi:predicted NAD/FAD-dependent oxidoreductase
LHNNVRMTWGKALLGWTRSAREALRLMNDLNNRYALDGNDPNSYGGILWCLGLFDRPFEPEVPIFGSVRTRPTTEHAKQIDLRAFCSWVGRPARRNGLSVAVVGAGVSGLFAARILTDHGIDVQLYEKSRGTGGRLATRRIDDLAFDIGAQYFTARDERFSRYVDSWIRDGIVRPWQGRVAALEGQEVREKGHSPRRYVGVPGMTMVSRHLADGLKIMFESRIVEVRRENAKWRLIFESGDASPPHDVLLVATPPLQAAPLLKHVPQLAATAASVQFQPCWTAMAAFNQPLPMSFDGVFLNSPALAWAARNSSKPGRADSEGWVIHASPEWSASHLEDEGTAVATALLDEFFQGVGSESCEPTLLRAHRWRYARANPPLSVGCLWDPARRIGACGDWCAGSRVEGAALSGMAMAGGVMGLPDRGPAAFDE